MFLTYYYTPSSSYANVYLFSICDSLEKSITFIKEKFINFNAGVSNTFTCNSKKFPTVSYVMWINFNEINKIIPYTGLTCSQPCNSISVINELNKNIDFDPFNEKKDVFKNFFDTYK